MVFGLMVWIVGYLYNLTVMGGATRNLVAHLLWNESVSARATYAGIRSRFFSLLGATLLVMIWIGVVCFIALFAWYLVLIAIIFAFAVFIQVAPPWLSGVMVALGILASLALPLWLIFFLGGKVAYVPQAMLVEGKGVLEAFSRSFSLAKGNVRRLMAMFIFTSFATYSALGILIVPLGWFGYINGVDFSPLNQNEWPAWYAIGYNVVLQTSNILLAPVWMLGLSLLYVDERVRHEGYDIELMAARQLTEMPPVNVVSPLAPALSAGPMKSPPPMRPPMGNTLGLS